MVLTRDDRQKKNCQYLSICPGPTETALLTLIFFLRLHPWRKLRSSCPGEFVSFYGDDGSMVSRLSSAGAMEPLLLQLDDEGNAQARGQGDGLGHKKCLVR
jgi:hypothetical protein